MAIEPSNDCQSRLVLSNSASDPCLDTLTSSFDSKAGPKRIKRDDQKSFDYSGALGRIAFRKTKRFGIWPESTLLDEKCTTSYQLPWLPYNLEFQHTWTKYTPLQFSLNITHIVPRNSALHVKLWRVCRVGTLQELQLLLTSGQLSIYSKCGGRSIFYASGEEIRVRDSY